MGVPNRATAEARAAIVTLLEGRIDRLTLLLDKVEANDPARALSLYLQLLEFYIPKLSRVETPDLQQRKEDLSIQVRFV